MRSQAVQDKYSWHEVHGNVLVARSVWTANGVVAFRRQYEQYVDTEPARQYLRRRTPNARWERFSIRGVTYIGWANVWPHHSHTTPRNALLRSDMIRWEFPIWPLVATTIVLPVIALKAHVRKRLRERNCQCVHCGYDLRATPERCPKCGAEPAISGPRAAGNPHARGRRALQSR
jgi:hypothetical protein